MAKMQTQIDKRDDGIELKERERARQALRMQRDDMIADSKRESILEKRE